MSSETLESFTTQRDQRELHSFLDYGQKEYSRESQSDDLKEFPSGNRRDVSLLRKKYKNQNSGFSLGWKDLCVTIKDKTDQKDILKDISGFLYPGSCLAVIGSSGAGKTTFLDVLAGRNTSAQVTGKIIIENGLDIKSVSQYCPQDDALLGNLTVWETFYFAAKFNLSKNIKECEINSLVDDIISEYGLSDVKDVVIGTPLKKGCSGGQKRRVAVGTQVLGMEGGIIFLDEPTSGLDSVGAFSVIESVRDLAANHFSTVICTIHQPSFDTFELFTHVMILAKGRQVFFGSREECLHYFSSIDRPIPKFSNPCDEYLKMTNIDFAEDRDEFERELEYLFTSFLKSASFKSILERVHTIEQSTIDRNVVPFKARNGFIYETIVLLKRTLLNARKNPLAYWVRIVFYSLLGLVLGTVFYNMPNTQERYIDKITVVCFSVNFLTFMAIASMPSILENRKVFIREISNELYSVGSYMLSDFLVSIPFIGLLTASFSLSCYFLVGFERNLQKFGVYVKYLYITLLITEAQVSLIGHAVPIMILALTTGAVGAAFWMTISGLGVTKTTSIPFFWRETFARFNYITFSIKAILKNEFSDIIYDCTPNELLPDRCFCRIRSELNSQCQFKGSDVLSNLEKTTTYLRVTLELLAVLLAYKIITYIFLKVRFDLKSK